MTEAEAEMENEERSMSEDSAATCYTLMVVDRVVDRNMAPEEFATLFASAINPHLT